MTLVSAPAGFGKSTLISAWAQRIQSNQQVAWLSLDEADNDLKRFLSYLIAAIQSFEGEFGQGAMAALGSQGAVNLEALLTTLINEIAGFSQKGVLILDDYHVIESQPIDQAITFLLDHLPATLHLVIATRMDPSWPLARLRARGEMLEIRVDDLRFALEEATGFLNQAMGFDLSPDDVAALDARTEGWITGLQLAALSMQGSDDVQGFVRAFRGSNRYILDYLGEEVLSHQPENIHSFLLKTSILNQLTGPLCDAITGSSGGEKTLANLEQDNLFIIPLDDERRWFRYHHLFADLLLRHLHQTFPELVPELHQQASLWYEKAGNLSEAFRYALLANDIPRATRILEIEWYQYINRGELKKLQEMLTTLGPEITGQNPILSMAYCWLYSMLGRYDAIPDHLDAVRQLLETNAEFKSDPTLMKFAVLPSLIETIEATLKCESGNPAEAKEHALKAISFIPEQAEPATKGLLKVTADYWLALALKGLAHLIWIQAQMAISSQGADSTKTTILNQCLDYLDQRLKVAHQRKLSFRIIECSLIMAMVLNELEHTNRAVKMLEQTLALAEPEEYYRVFLDLGQPLSLLLQKVDTNHTDANFAQRLIAKIAVLTRGKPASQNLLDSLSVRELEVLGLISRGLSNREIGEQLHLALDTIKGHNRRIFEKLGVRKRIEAVEKARQLGLL